MSKEKVIELLEADVEMSYRNVKQLIDAVERMPDQIKKCQFTAPAFIPPEFRKLKMPSNAFFAGFNFTMGDLTSQLEKLKEVYGLLLSKEMKSKIDKGE